MQKTRWWAYAESLIGDSTAQDAANRAGFDKSNFSRWKRGAKADPAFAVQLARAFGGNVLEALVAAGLITDDEAQLHHVAVGGDEALRSVSDPALVEEVLRRMQEGRTDATVHVLPSRTAAMDDDDVDALVTLNPAAFDADGDDLDAEVEAQQQEP